MAPKLRASGPLRGPSFRPAALGRDRRATPRHRSRITRFGPFDILFGPSGAPAYADLERRALVLRRFDHEIAVASIEDLIAMKRATGREKDATHLTILLEFMEMKDILNRPNS